MAKLIIKNGYLKGGKKNAAHRSHLVKYIATRDGVEKIQFRNKESLATDGQQTLIQELLSDYPDSINSYEYEDYRNHATANNASEFITQTLEQFVVPKSDNEKYVNYIANRPRVEVIDTHGLFSGGGRKIILSQIAEEIATHKGNVWTPIISLRREDADSTDYQTAAAWKSLISSKVFQLAESLKIHPDNFRWYGAFHNEGHHPHVHLICYSTNPNEGYLNRAGIEKMKSVFANEIFKQQLIPLYQKKTMQRDELKRQVKSALQELQEKIARSDYKNPQLEGYITELAQSLQSVKGKLQYGYLPKTCKKLINHIVDEIAKEPNIKNAYTLWCELQEELYHYYQDVPLEQPLLSEQKEFKAIKNVVIQEVLKMNLEQIEEIALGHDLANYHLRDLKFQSQDLEKAEENLIVAAEQGIADAQYRLGKRYLLGKDEERNQEQAFRWLQLSANQGNEQAQFFLDHMNQWHNPLVGMCCTRLLNQLGRLLQDALVQDSTTSHQYIDGKQRRKMMEKKLARGLKNGNQEQENVNQRFTI